MVNRPRYISAKAPPAPGGVGNSRITVMQFTSASWTVLVAQLYWCLVVQAVLAGLSLVLR